MVDKIQSFFSSGNSAATQRLQLPSGEIKTALQVAIFGNESRDGTTFYVIRIWTIDSPGAKSEPIKKRYSQFDELNQLLTTQNYMQLPALPQKKLFLTSRDTAERQ